MAAPKCIQKITDTIWEIPKSYKEGMKVPARIYANEKIMEDMEDGVFEQITNVATLPGIVKHACCMPDGHWGYGFPIGGVAAMDSETGVISPGGIGFDINCGVRMIVTNLTHKEVKPHLHKLVDNIFQKIPAGVGGKGMLKMTQDDFCELAEQGTRWCVKNGYGWQEDLERTEQGGSLPGADISKVSEKAIKRGFKQVGSLGSGNHFLELQIVKQENIFDGEIAKLFGITQPDQLVIMIHCGSRGFGHQIASDYLQKFLEVMEEKYKIKILDRELAGAPFHSQEGQDYYGAMNCAINMAFANRQLIMHGVREVFSDFFKKDARDLGMSMVYDVAHNTAKLENHIVDGEKRELLVHRKGATRAFGPGNKELPEIYQPIGQPVIIGGSMQTSSYLLVGIEEGSESFYTTAHGSGRTMSRSKARKKFHGKKLKREMQAQGIYVRPVSFLGLAEEAGGAYKNVNDVIASAESAGLSRKVLRTVPIGNIKG